MKLIPDLSRENSFSVPKKGFGFKIIQNFGKVIVGQISEAFKTSEVYSYLQERNFRVKKERVIYLKVMSDKTVVHVTNESACEPNCVAEIESSANTRRWREKG